MVLREGVYGWGGQEGEVRFLVSCRAKMLVFRGGFGMERIKRQQERNGGRFYFFLSWMDGWRLFDFFHRWVCYRGWYEIEIEMLRLDEKWKRKIEFSL